MTQELIYTSAPRGLKPGSRGFCTVAATSGIPPRTVGLLESLSGYRHTQTPPGGPHPDNPVVWSHLKISSNESLLSRIADAGLDYSGRTNKLAHHILVRRDQQGAAGPAAELMADGNFLFNWSGEPRILNPRALDPGTASQGNCATWQQTVGDAGWAGVLAETASGGSPRTCYLIVDPSTPSLALIEEALSLLPVNERWDVTFSTYYTGLPPGVNCLWRCVLKGSPEHRSVPPHDRVVRIDVTSPLGHAPSTPFVEMARSGRRSAGPPAVPSQDAAAGTRVAGAAANSPGTAATAEPTSSRTTSSGSLEASYSQDRERQRKAAFQRAEQERLNVGSEPPSVPPPRVITQPPRRGLRKLAFAAVLLLFVVAGAAALLLYSPLGQQLANRLAQQDANAGSQELSPQADPSPFAGSADSNQSPTIANQGTGVDAAQMEDEPDAPLAKEGLKNQANQGEPKAEADRDSEPPTKEGSAQVEPSIKSTDEDPPQEADPEAAMTETEKPSQASDDAGDPKPEEPTPPAESPTVPDKTNPNSKGATENDQDPAATTTPDDDPPADQPEPASSPVTLTYLLNEKEWTGLKVKLKSQQEWDGDEDPRSHPLAKERKPKSVAILTLDTEKKRLLDDESLKPSERDPLQINDLTNPTELYDVPVLTCKIGELTLEPNFAKKIGRNYIAVQYDNNEIEMFSLRGCPAPVKEPLIRVPFDGKGITDVAKDFATQDKRLLSIASIELASPPPESWTLESSDDGNTIKLTRELPELRITISAEYHPSDPRIEVQHAYELTKEQDSEPTDNKDASQGDPPPKPDPVLLVKQETQKLKDLKVAVATQLLRDQKQLSVELARFRIQFD